MVKDSDNFDLVNTLAFLGLDDTLDRDDDAFHDRANTTLPTPPLALAHTPLRLPHDDVPLSPGIAAPEGPAQASQQFAPVVSPFNVPSSPPALRDERKPPHVVLKAARQAEANKAKALAAANLKKQKELEARRLKAERDLVAKAKQQEARRIQSQKDKARALALKKSTAEKQAALLAKMPQAPQPKPLCTPTAFASAFVEDDEGVVYSDGECAEATKPATTHTKPSVKTTSPFELLAQKPTKLKAWLCGKKSVDIPLDTEGVTLCSRALMSNLPKHAEVIIMHDPMLALQVNADESYALNALIENRDMRLLTIWHDSAVALPKSDYNKILKRKLCGSSGSIKQALISLKIIHDAPVTEAPSPVVMCQKRDKKLSNAILCFNKTQRPFIQLFREAMRMENAEFFENPINDNLISRIFRFSTDDDCDASEDYDDAESVAYHVHADEPYFMALVIAIFEKNFWAIQRIIEKVDRLDVQLEHDTKKGRFFNLFHLIFRGNILGTTWDQSELLRLVKIICNQINAIEGEYATRVINRMLNQEDENFRTPLSILVFLEACDFYSCRNAMVIIDFLQRTYLQETPSRTATVAAEDDTANLEKDDDASLDDDDASTTSRPKKMSKKTAEAPPLPTRAVLDKHLEKLRELKKTLGAELLPSDETSQLEFVKKNLYEAVLLGDLEFFSKNRSFIFQITQWAFSLLDPSTGIVSRKIVASTIPLFVPLILTIHAKKFDLIQYVLNQIEDLNSFTSHDSRRNIFHQLFRGKVFVNTLWNEDELIRLVQMICNHPTFDPEMLSVADIHGVTPMNLLKSLNSGSCWYSSADASNIVTYLEYSHAE